MGLRSDLEPAFHALSADSNLFSWKSASRLCRSPFSRATASFRGGFPLACTALPRRHMARRRRRSAGRRLSMECLKRHRIAALSEVPLAVLPRPDVLSLRKVFAGTFGRTPQGEATLLTRNRGCCQCALVTLRWSKRPQDSQTGGSFDESPLSALQGPEPRIFRELL
jgi:hypothetical protein